MNRKWKSRRPSSLRHALELCKDCAKDKKNLSVERIAELMGLPDHWALYKWLQNGRMPAVMIPPYEAACGAHFVTHWLASSTGKVLIDIPTGRKAQPTDINQLQQALNQAAGAIISFYNGSVGTEETLNAIRVGMEGLAWHHGNVGQTAQPQLELGETDDE